MEFGVLWYYPMLNLPMLPVDKIMAGEFEWALLQNRIVEGVVDGNVPDFDTVIPKGLAWCNAFEFAGMESPWTMYNTNMKTKTSCQNYPISSDTYLGSITASDGTVCNYFTRAGSVCYYQNLD